MKRLPSRERITVGSTRTISPTIPMSMISVLSPSPGTVTFILRARMSWPSLPLRPTAAPPCWLTSATISLLTLPTSTISMMSMVSESVTRMPRT